MQSLRLLMVSAIAAPLLSAPAMAQVQMYPGQDVRVNPAGIRSGEVLLEPGGKMARVVPPLREPGGKNGPIHLHMPRRHRAATHVAATPAQPETAIAAPAEETPPPKPPVHHRRVAMTPPPAPSTAPEPQAAAPGSSASAVPFSFGETDSTAPTATPLSAPPKPAAKLAVATPPPATSKPEETPVPASGGTLTERGSILFHNDATDPVPAAADGIRMLAGNLNDALLKGAERIEILAYGGRPGDKSSDARRLSLKRALTIREMLIEHGVPSDRIDVRAMGGADSGDPNRVDVFVKTG